MIGLVLKEEISMSWLNANIMVRAWPSVSAHTLFSPISPDVMHKVILLILIAASAATGTTQTVLTFLGIGGVCLVLLANLGARSWYFLKWRPMRYEASGSPLVAFVSAVVAGIVVPYMGDRNIEVGGKPAIEYILRSAILVGGAFCFSAIEEVQTFFVVGTEVRKLDFPATFSIPSHTFFALQNCPQTIVNYVVGIWWFVTLVICLFLARKAPAAKRQPPEEAERLLVEDHASPAGYKIKALPDFEIDPLLAREGSAYMSVDAEFSLGLIVAAAGCGFAMYLSHFGWSQII
jgi:hypothetical protein